MSQPNHIGKMESAKQRFNCAHQLTIALKKREDRTRQLKRSLIIAPAVSIQEFVSISLATYQSFLLRRNFKSLRKFVIILFAVAFTIESPIKTAYKTNLQISFH